MDFTKLLIIQRTLLYGGSLLQRYRKMVTTIVLDEDEKLVISSVII